MRIIVTGGDGFIGSRLCAAFAEDRAAQVIASIAGPKPINTLLPNIKVHVSGPISGQTNWRKILQKGDIVVHLAARVHVMKDTSKNPLTEFRGVNVTATENLARQAAAVGVKRLMFMSTVGVNGNDSGGGAYDESDDPKPQNFYAISKYEAEQRLSVVGRETGLEVVILRAPLVYGPGNPGNFKTLLWAVYKGIPLPFKSIRNIKSFIYVGNLVSAIMVCATHPAAIGQTYLVGDSESISTPDLLYKLAAGLGRPPRLFSLPVSFLKFVSQAFGKSAALKQLTGSLAIDSSKIRNNLGWTPCYTLDEGIRDTTAWYKSIYEAPL